MPINQTTKIYVSLGQGENPMESDFIELSALV